MHRARVIGLSRLLLCERGRTARWWSVTGLLGLGLLVPACPEPGGTDTSAATSADSGATTGTSSPTGGSGVDETGTVAGCEDPEAAVEAIFMASCLGAGCHGDEASGGLDLLAPGWQERLIGQPSSTCDGWVRVVPGDLDASFLVNKLFSQPACGASMPLGQPLLPEEIACIESWVAQLEPSSCDMCGGDTCVDLMTDAQHCGGCDSACPESVPCQDGSCACPPGTVLCGDACVDTNANGQHCGDCDSPCEPGLLCNAGTCAAGCDGLTECDGGCVDTTTDGLHCGGCSQPCTMGAGCMGGACECGGPDATYTQDIEPLFVGGCASMGCHGFPMPQLGLDLRAGAGYADMVGVGSAQCAGQTLVVPGQPGSSYLMNKLLGVDMCLGTRMPKGLEPLSADELDLVSSWICKGAVE